jgi:flagellar motor protein MotB
MPRGEYTLHEPSQLGSSAVRTPKVSMDRYEVILELYEAQNALGIAQAAQADRYAPLTFVKAQQLYATAQNLESSKASASAIVQNAREAVETAEDARMIAERRREEETLVNARTEAANAKQAVIQAQQEAQNARLQADEAQTRADAERAARERAEAEAEAARRQTARADATQQAALTQPKIAIVTPRPDSRKSDLRMRVLEQLNGVLAMRDTARGLVATVPDSDFAGTQLHPAVSAQLARVAAIVKAHPGLHIDVRGNSDSSAGAEMSSVRAEAVRRALIAQGFPENRVSAGGLGDTDLFGPNTSAAGRIANRRVEIVISGDSIGDLPFWDHPYALTPDL